MTLLPDYALTYINNLRKATEPDKTTGEVKPYYPRRSEFSDWLAPGFNAGGVYDTCAQHAIWQYVLQGQEVFAALTQSLTTLAEPMYGPMYQALEALPE
jgi:exodeoxyribonuclease V gamma subunit